MKRQEVVCGLRQTTDRCQAADALMGAMPIVMMDPSIEHVSALRRMIVGNTVCPLTQGRLDESLGLAIGLRSIWSSKAMFDFQAAAGLGEGFGAECCAVIGQAGGAIRPVSLHYTAIVLGPSPRFAQTRCRPR